MNKKYKPGIPITSLDQLMRQEQVLFIPLNKVFSYGWFASWQLHYAMNLIKKRWLYVAVSECVITVRPENNDGCMVAKMPASWLKIGPPRKGSHREYTEKEKEQLRERIKVAQAAKEAKKKGSAVQ